MKRVDVAILGALVLAFLAGGILFFRQSRNVSYGEFRVTYAALPADDAALGEWLRTQPGVMFASVRRSGLQVRMYYELEAGSSIHPNPTTQAEKLGYGEPTGFESSQHTAGPFAYRGSPRDSEDDERVPVPASRQAP